MSIFVIGVGAGFLSVALADSVAPRPPTLVVVVTGLLFIIVGQMMLLNHAAKKD